MRPALAANTNRSPARNQAPSLDATNHDRETYEAVNRQNAEGLKTWLKPDDIVVVHDPQPLAMGGILKGELGIHGLALPYGAGRAPSPDPGVG